MTAHRSSHCWTCGRLLDQRDPYQWYFCIDCNELHPARADVPPGDTNFLFVAWQRWWWLWLLAGASCFLLGALWALS